MKLHIPTSLRKALLTCMAAAMTPSFAGFAASGSFVAGSAVVISLCAQQAEAALTTRKSQKKEGGENVTYSGRIFTIVNPTANQDLSTASYKYDSQLFPEQAYRGSTFTVVANTFYSVTNAPSEQMFWHSFYSDGEFGQTIRFTESCNTSLNWTGLYVGGFIVESGATANITGNGGGRNIFLQGATGTECNITAHGSMTFTTTDTSFYLRFTQDGVIRVARGSSVILDGYRFEVGNGNTQANVIIKGIDGSAGSVSANNVISLATNSSLTVSEGAMLTTSNGSEGDGVLKLDGGTLNIQATRSDPEDPESELNTVSIQRLQVDGGKSGTLVGNSYTIQNVTLGTDEEGATLSVNSGRGQINGLGGSGTVEVSGSLTHLSATSDGEHPFTGRVSVSDGATLELGATLGEATIELGGNSRLSLSQAIENKIFVRDGFIENASNLQGEVTLSMQSGSIDLTGMDAQYLHFEENAGSVSGLRRGSTLTFNENDSIVLGADNVTREGGSGTDFVRFNGSGSVNFSENGKLTIDIDADVAKNMDGKYVLWISNGSIDGDTMQKLIDKGLIQFDGQLVDMVCTLERQGNTGFRLLIDGNTKGIWYASNRSDIENFDWGKDLYDRKSWKGVYVDKDMDVSLEATAEENHIEIPHLKGDSGKTLSLKNTGSDSLTVELSNDDYDSGNLTTSGNSEMKGEIEVGDNVRVEKTGPNRLTIGGNIRSNGELALKEGNLLLEGTRNSIGILSEGDTNARAVVDASLTVNGSLTLTQKSTLEKGTIINGRGTLSLEQGLELKGASRLEGSLTINFNSSVSELITGKEASVGSLSGSGTRGSLYLGEKGENLAEGGNLTISGGKTGSFGGALNGAGTISVTGNADQKFSGSGNQAINFRVGSQPQPVDPETPEDNPSPRAAGADAGTLRLSGKEAKYGNVEVLGTGKLVVGPSAEKNSNVKVSGLTLKSGSGLELLIDSNDLIDRDVNNLAEPLHADSLSVEKGARLEVQFAERGTSLLPDEDLNVRLLEGSVEIVKAVEEREGVYQPGDVFADSDLKLDSVFRLYYNDLKVEFRDNGVYLSGTAIHGNPLTQTANTVNSKAGATLLWGARDVLQSESADPTLAGVMDYVMQNVNSAPAEVNHLMSAVVGSTVTALGAAQRDSMRRQLSRIRQHSNTLGLTPGYQYDEMPYYHTWIEGTGSYSHLRSDGDASGYEHEAWGGSFGIDADVTEHTSLGMSVTALYGNLDAEANDTATGHLDSYYLSGIMRTQVGRWGHTFIVAGGIDRAKLDRTVSYPADTYATKGTTHGWSLGAVYEITYDIPIGEEQDSLIQPLVNLSYIRSSMKGYNESGPTAMNLCVDDQVWDTATLGIGARWIGSLAETVLERRVQVELSAMVLQDMGDSQGSADISLQAAPGARQTIYGAEYGRTAVQAGVALRVPVSDQALFYLNTDAEFRQGNTSWQASVGVRYDF